MKDLQEMTVEELKALKQKWYDENTNNGNITKLTQMGRVLGDKVSANYGPKYELYDRETDIEIYVDDYGGYMTVKQGHKLKVSTHNEKIYVPGEWESIIPRLYPQADEVMSHRIADQNNSERNRLLDELT